MSLDKAIKSGKEHRKEYRGIKRYVSACRNHGSCDYCKDNRLYNKRKTDEQANIDFKEWRKEST